MSSGNMLVDRHEQEDRPEERNHCFECDSSPCRCEEFKATRQNELEAYCPTFEMFLIQKWCDVVNCTEYDALDDDAEEACSNWINSLDVELVQKYCEEYGKHCFRKGQKVGK